MDGIEACGLSVETKRPPEDTFLSFLLARGRTIRKWQGFDAGPNDIITKPIKPKVLVSKVKALA